MKTLDATGNSNKNAKIRTSQQLILPNIPMQAVWVFWCPAQTYDPRKHIFL